MPGILPPIVATVSSQEEAQRLINSGLRFGGTRHRVTQYWEVGADTVCPRCCGIGHASFGGCHERPPCCFICGGPHEGLNHACQVVNCPTKEGQPCLHHPAKCGNCEGSHQALDRSCPRLREARKQWKQRKDRALQERDARAWIPDHLPLAVVVSTPKSMPKPKPMPKPTPEPTPEPMPEPMPEPTPEGGHPEPRQPIEGPEESMDDAKAPDENEQPPTQC